VQTLRSKFYSTVTLSDVKVKNCKASGTYEWEGLFGILWKHVKGFGGVF
jgi:hypothetical protein